MARSRSFMEGLLWVEPMPVSPTALDKRFRKLPVASLATC